MVSIQVLKTEFFFLIGVQLINSIVLVSSVRQSEIHIYVYIYVYAFIQLHMCVYIYILFIFFFFMIYYRILNVVLCYGVAPCYLSINDHI